MVGPSHLSEIFAGVGADGGISHVHWEHDRSVDSITCHHLTALFGLMVTVHPRLNGFRFGLIHLVYELH